MPRATSDTPWLGAAVAWEVCASIHAQYAKGKDPFFKTTQGDYQKHAIECRTRHSTEGNGLAKAVAYLRGTAADYRQMAERIELPPRNHFPWTKSWGEKQGLLAKAELLEGQAKHIEEL